MSRLPGSIRIASDFEVSHPSWSAQLVSLHNLVVVMRSLIGSTCKTVLFVFYLNVILFVVKLTSLVVIKRRSVVDILQILERDLLQHSLLGHVEVRVHIGLV